MPYAIKSVYCDIDSLERMPASFPASFQGNCRWMNFGRMRTGRRRYCIDPVDETVIMLRKMVTASRRADVQFEFGKHSACLTEIVYHTLELFHSKVGERIMTWPHTVIEKRASYYSKGVHEKGSALPNVVGFIDETAINIARPGGLRQRESYSGHKRRNCVKFQALWIDFTSVWTIEGRRHDMTLYRE
jgi:hypothetical protein